MDPEATGLNLGLKCMQRGIKPNGAVEVILALSDNSYHKFRLSEGGSIACDDSDGSGYDGEVNDTVDTLLEDEEVMGLITDSGSIASHLGDTGNFTFEGKDPVKYTRSGREYHTF